MKTWISILRGINVSGHNLIKMKSLEELEKMIARGILNTFGFEVPVIVLGGEDLMSVSENNPFITPGGRDSSMLHVTFLSGEPERSLLETIGKEAYLPDEFYINGKAVYLFCPGGYGNTKLSNNFFEKKHKVRATTRNWKTILELVKISGLS